MPDANVAPDPIDHARQQGRIEGASEARVWVADLIHAEAEQEHLTRKERHLLLALAIKITNSARWPR
jgi:hypothetical protein